MERKLTYITEKRAKFPNIRRVPKNQSGNSPMKTVPRI